MDTLAFALLFLGAAIWIGGLATVIVVVSAARSALGDLERVVFMRALGQRFLRVMGAAGIVLLLAASWHVRERPFDAPMAWAAVTTLALIAALSFGVAQARAMGRLREAAIDGAEADLGVRVAAGARRAAALRTGIVVLSVALVVQGAVLVTGA